MPGPIPILETRLNAFWLSKLGIDRLRDCPGGEQGRSGLEKGLGVLGRLGGDREAFHDLLWDGFDGYFHQTVYLRKGLDRAAVQALESVREGARSESCTVWSIRPEREQGRERIRLLLGVDSKLEFLIDGRLVVHPIRVPAVAEADRTKLRVRVLTVQSTAQGWSEVLREGVDRTLSSIRANDLADTILDALYGGGDVAPGEPQDMSSRVLELMNETDVFSTFSGTLAVMTVGRTRHSTEGGLPGGRRKALHEVMTSEFKQLAGARELYHCELELRTDWGGLPRGTAVVLYPAEGKLVFRKMLGGGVIDDFLAFLAD